MNKKVIYLEIDSDITSAVDEIRKNAEEELLLFVPAGATTFRSRMNLKILKKSARECKKHLTIITPDKKVRAILKEIKIKSSSELPSDFGEKREKVATERNKKKEGDDKIDLEENNDQKLSVSAFLSKERKKKKHPFSFVKRVSGDDPDREYGESFGKKGPSKLVLAGFFFGGLVLLFFIFSLILPSAKVRVSPASSEIRAITNFIMAPSKKNPEKSGNFISLETVEKEMERTISFPTTGKQLVGRKARGEITIYNIHPRNKIIIPSRFQSEDGLIYWTKEEVTMPGRNEDGTPGEITVTVIADDFDIKGHAQGDRASIEAGNKFFLPAIPFLSPQFYWAENKKPIGGADVKTKKVIAKGDVEFAQNKIVSMLEKELLSEIKNELLAQNALVLDFPAAFSSEVISVDSSATSEGEFAESFVVTARVKVKVYTYKKSDLLFVISSRLQSKVHPQMVLNNPDLDKLELRFLKMEVGEVPIFKIEVELLGSQRYDFSEGKKGNALRDKVRRRILGEGIDEAENLLREFPEIDDAKISVSPFFMSSLPIVGENIKVVVD